MKTKTNTKTHGKTKTLDILICALALLVPPAAGFAQDAGSLPPDFARSADAVELGDVGPSIDAVRLLVAKDVSDREPVDVGSEFSIADTTHLFAYVELSNPNLEQTVVTVTWVNGATGESKRSFELEIGPHKRFRTWARATAPREPGAWSIVLTDADGNELGRTDFSMVQ